MLCFEIPTDGVMSPGVVVSGVLLAGDHVLGVEEVPVGACPHLRGLAGLLQPHLVYDRRLKVNKDCPWYMFPRGCLGEEHIEGVITDSEGVIGGHLPIRHYTLVSKCKYSRPGGECGYNRLPI